MTGTEYVLIVIRNIGGQGPSDYVDAIVAKGYRVEYVLPGQDPVPVMQKHPPIAACFQFDYPDTSGLTDLRMAKQLVPSVPLLMLTQAHSESLAVWAFRTRVWDYFVHPVDVPRLLTVIDALKNFQQPGPAVSRSKKELELTNAIPPEARQHYRSTNQDQVILDRALTYLDKNLHTKIVQSEVAELCGLSAFRFSRLFRKMTQVTFQEYVLRRRVEEAKRLLENPKASVTDVCFTVGFRDLSYFTRVFQRYVGLPPSRYRQTWQAAGQPELDALAHSAAQPSSTRVAAKNSVA